MQVCSKPFVRFISASVGAFFVLAVLNLTLWGKDSAPKITVSATPINRDIKLGTSFAPIVKIAAPSVVNISSTSIVRDRPSRNPFRQFYGGQSPDDNAPRSHRAESLGSGVIISPDGYILTANHVVEGAVEILVTVDGNKKPFTAKIVGTDPPTDIAVLKINAKDLPAITLADSDQLEVGDVVLAIGDPFDVGQTVTTGIVSGLGRSGLGFSGYENFIQTDAAINPGNSGGALVDAEGRLVGINTAIVSESGGNQGIGFAVPVNMARRAAERLISGGKISRGLIGVVPQDITPALAQAFNLPDENGALVGSVKPNMPAEKAGIKSGDVIVGFNGKKVTDANDLILQVSDCAPGSTATVDLIQDGHPKTISVVLAENHQLDVGSNDGNNSNAAADNSKTDALDGVTVEDLDGDARAGLSIPASIKGALISEVADGSNSADAGLQKGDVILEINRQTVADSASAVNLCNDAKGNQILLKIWRHDGGTGSTLWIGVDNVKK
jgi:serine protease Do